MTKDKETKKDTQVSEKKETKQVGNKETKNLNEALLELAKREISIPRNGKGKIDGKTYAYATLDDTLRAMKPVLAEVGIITVFSIEDAVLTLTATHVASNEVMKSSQAIGEVRGIQDYGSRITYLRRYLFQSIFNLALDEDVDGSGDKGEVPQGKKEKRGEESTAPTPYEKAKKALETCDDETQEEAIRSAIADSDKLTQDEKDELLG